MPDIKSFNKQIQLTFKSIPSLIKSSSSQVSPCTVHFSVPLIAHIYDEIGTRQIIDKLVSSTEKDTRIKRLSIELGRLAQGNIHGVLATDTIDFIYKLDVPLGDKVTYAQYVCDHRPLKPEPYRVRIVVGGDKLDCEIDSGAPATNLAEFKLLINSVISDAKQGAKF